MRFSIFGRRKLP